MHRRPQVTTSAALDQLAPAPPAPAGPHVDPPRMAAVSISASSTKDARKSEMLAWNGSQRGCAAPSSALSNATLISSLASRTLRMGKKPQPGDLAKCIKHGLGKKNADTIPPWLRAFQQAFAPECARSGSAALISICCKGGPKNSKHRCGRETSAGGLTSQAGLGPNGSNACMLLQSSPPGIFPHWHLL